MKEKMKKQHPEPEQELFAGEAAAKPQEMTYPVTVDGEEMQLTLAQLTEAAAAGLSRRNASIRLGRAAQQVPSGQIYAAFMQAYPEVTPEAIPLEVWEDAREEGSLVSAYRKWEIRQLKMQLAAAQKNAENRARAVGPAAGEGQPAGIDPIAEALLR